MRTDTAKILALPAALAIAVALSACGTDDTDQGSGSDSGTAVTVEQHTDSDAAGGASASTAAPAPKSASGEVRVLIDGQPVAADFANARCEWGEDDGVEQLEFDAGTEGSGKLEVQIDMHNPPRLDDFEFDGPGDDWEAEDRHKSAATIQVDNDTYTVTSTVEQDDGDREATMVAVFTCPR